MPVRRMMIVVTDRSGDVRTIAADEGCSLMEALRHGGVDDLLALCGGCCSCATCHVYVDGDAALPDMSEDEDDLLDTSTARRRESRLSCQIPLLAVHDGLRITLAPED